MWLGWSHHFKRFTVTIITWLTATEYLCYKWPRICSTCRIHNPVLSTFMTYHRVSSKSNTTGATCETETFSLSDELTPGFKWGSYCLIYSFLVECFVDHYLSVFFWPRDCLFVFDFSASDYPICIFKKFLQSTNVRTILVYKTEYE